MKKSASIKKFNKARAKHYAQLYKNYESIVDEYSGLIIEDLKKERFKIIIKIYSDDCWMKKHGHQQVLSTNAFTLSVISILLSLCTFLEKDFFVLFIFIMILFIIIVSIFGMKTISEKYKNIKPKYLENKLRLEVLNQIIEERQPSNFRKCKKCIRKCLHRKITINKN